MKKSTRKRDANRLLKILHARVAKDAQHIPITILPLEAIPEAVLKRAVLSRPRRAKGIPRAKRIWPEAN
jgi:hypothetical protein